MYMRHTMEKELANPSRLDLTQAELEVMYEKRRAKDAVDYAEWAASRYIEHLNRIMLQENGLKIACEIVNETDFLENTFKVYLVQPEQIPTACRMVRVWVVETLKQALAYAGRA